MFNSESNIFNDNLSDVDDSRTKLCLSDKETCTDK